MAGQPRATVFQSIRDKYPYHVERDQDRMLRPDDIRGMMQHHYGYLPNGKGKPALWCFANEYDATTFTNRFGGKVTKRGNNE